MFDQSDGFGIIKVNKRILLETIKKNLEQHCAAFLEADKGYKQAVVAELRKALDEAEKGVNYRTSVVVAKPTDHSSDYIRVIRMLEFSVDDEIEVTEQQFNQFVLDEWGWKLQFDTITSMYNSPGVRV